MPPFLVTQREIKRLYKRFTRLDRDGDGVITTEEFSMIPELAVNPLRNRVISLFDTGMDDTVNFKSFVQTLSVFSVKGDVQKKIDFAFRVYDLNGDGFISEEELFIVLKQMVGANLSDVQLQEIVEKTMKEADEDGDKMISREEFAKVMNSSDMESKMTIRF
eukprot:TRINITY_DN181_c0_g1_i6.p2 TRINITY_DN181_c0_g1~~TRINITY_DN181_c0_g1_i6.p2  ORF type:complete len:162 (+),score=51.33 TRINITY_DN181_c0_g1_i6:289-774(+)